MTRLSERYNERTYFAMLQNVWTLPCLIALRFWPGVVKDAWGTYALITILLAYPYCRTNSHPPSSPLTANRPCFIDAINGAWVSKNANNVGTRTIASAIYNVTPPSSLATPISNTHTHSQMSVQLGGVCHSFIYVDSDKPLYRHGNTTLIIINIASIGVFLLAKAYYVRRNKQKERVWRGKSEAERAAYIKYSSVKGCQRLDFRFAH